jgi:hypothetical protein
MHNPPTVNAHLPKFHHIGGQGARLVRENVRDLAQLVIEVHGADDKRVGPSLPVGLRLDLLVHVHQVTGARWVHRAARAG